MSANNDRGFVDFIGETMMKNQFGEGVGVIDVILCANCLETAATLIGGVTKGKAEEWGYREAELSMEIEKLQDEVASWQQRFLGMAQLDVDDFRKLAQLEEANKVVVPGSESPSS